MNHKKVLQFKLCVIAYLLPNSFLFAQQVTPDARTSDVSRWKTFTSRAGWTIKHPSNWRVGSCRSCPDPADPHAPVTLDNPSTEGLIVIERLFDKPPDRGVDEWLNKVREATNLNPLVHQEWILLDGMRALKAVTRSPGATESEDIYVLRGSSTFAIGTSLNTPSYSLCQRMLSTFRFTTRE